MKSNFDMIRLAMKNAQIVLILTSILVLVGIYGLFMMPRQEFPASEIRQGLVIGVFPGASSQQVEEQLTTKVENYLFGYKEVNKKKTYSISEENVMYVFIELANNVENPDQFWSKLKHGLSELKAELPSGVNALFANSDFGDTVALLLTIESDQASYKQLNEYLDQLANELRKVEAISKIKRYGMQNEEISIYLEDEKLALYGIKPMMVMAVLKTEGSVSYAGELDNGQVVMPIHVSPRYQSEQDVAEQIVYADPLGTVVRLKDVARIERNVKEPDSYVKVNGKKCLFVSLEMHPGNNIDHLGKEVDGILEDFTKTLPPEMSVNKITDLPHVVRGSINEFLIEFFIAIAAVILVTMLLLPMKVAAIAAITIPITELITIGLLYILGIELDTVSLAALIVVLGMVVDNAIVVIDDHLEHLDRGETPFNAALKSAKELAVPVLTATLAIIAAYLPTSYFMPGVAKDFFEPLPIAVAIALFISFIVAMLLVPLMNDRMITTGLKNLPRKASRRTFLEWVQHHFDRSLEFTFRKPKTVILVGILSVVVGALILKGTSQQMFPAISRNQFAIEIYLPTGSSLSQTAAVADSMEAILKKDKRVITYGTFIGTSSPRFHTTYAPSMPAKNFAQFIVNTESNEATEALLKEYEVYTNRFPQAHVRIKQLVMQPYKAPIEIRISGDNISDLKYTANQIKDILQRDARAIWVYDDFKEPLPGVLMDVNRDECNRVGLTKSVLATSLAIGTKGLPVSTMWEGDYPVDVVVHRVKDEAGSIEDIRNQYVSSPLFAASVPVRQIATPVPEWTEGHIIRRNGVRTLTVFADAAYGKLADEIFAASWPQIERIQLPAGVQLEVGGEREGMVEYFTPMYKALATSILLIFLMLLFQFRHSRYAFLIMVTMPLSLLGGAFGLFIADYPFGFTAFIGFISLCGIVIRNGIILVDYAESLRKQGYSIADAAVAAGKRRMRPIFLTSAAAAVGVIPMIFGRSLLWGPLASVTCFGLMFSMVLTLYVLPVLYATFIHSDLVPVEEEMLHD
jgi:multidrug efflux pump subunit AcrB